MESSFHIPPYLLCEKFAADGVVADLFPPDEQGARLLARNAKNVIVVQRSTADHEADESEGVTRVTCDGRTLPLARGRYDLVICVAAFGDGKSMEDIVREARSLLNPSGMIAITLPNRDSSVLEPSSRPDGLPDFLEFERNLRRHFPHVTLYAQQPLHGAVLSPLGRRRGSDGPLLDDRLIPEGGEAPTHFLALCSPRYRKVDDTTIAQLPFKTLADGMRMRLEKLEGALSVIRKENDARTEQLSSIRARHEELKVQLASAENEGREKSSLQSEIATLNDKLAHRETLLKEMEEAQSRHSTELNTQISLCHETNRTIRKLEQQLADSERMGELSRRDREDSDGERQSLLTQLHDSQNELKVKQRDLDDKVEQVAGVEAELASLHKEASKQRRELLSAREQVRKLILEVQDISDAGSDRGAIEAELERIRSQAAAERERLEGRADKVHRQLLEEIEAKENARREMEAVQVRLQEADHTAKAAQARNEQLKDQLSKVSNSQRDTANKQEDQAEELRQAQRANEDLGVMLQEKADELDRQTHAVEVLNARVHDAEGRARLLEAQIIDLHKALGETEKRCAQFQSEVASKASIASKLDDMSAQLELEIERASRLEAKLLTRSAELEEEVDRSAILEEKLAASNDRMEAMEEKIGDLQPEATSSKNARQRAMAAEAAVTDLEAVVEHMRKELLDTRSQNKQIQQDLDNAMEALAENEEGAEVQIHEAGRRIREMKANIVRLTEENETELMKVQEDLETELRHANSMLESRQGELWELREEVVRLRAQSAATIASAEKSGADVEMQHHISEQENLIQELKDERDRLRKDNEKQSRSLEVRKKNLKILAALLRTERAGRPSIDNDPHAEDDHPGDESSPAQSLVTRKLDIRSLIEEAGGVVSEEAFEEFDEALDDNFLQSLRPGSGNPIRDTSAMDEEEVDSVMDSVVLEKVKPRKPGDGEN